MSLHKVYIVEIFSSSFLYRILEQKLLTHHEMDGRGVLSLLTVFTFEMLKESSRVLDKCTKHIFPPA